MTDRLPPRRQEGFLTPVGWLYLMLSIAFVLALVAVIAIFVSGSHSTLAQRTADLVAERGSQLGLALLITPPPPGSPGSVLDMMEPVRTEVLTEYIVDNVLPADSSLWRYLAPLQPGVDVVLALSSTTATVSVTARAGRNGQFVTTRIASGTVAAANYIADGRVSTSTGLPGGVLPLALDESALAATVAARTAGIVAPRAVELDLGRNAYAAAADEAVMPAEHLRAVSAFLASQGGSAPPAMRTGQRLLLARVADAAPKTSSPAEGEAESASGPRIAELLVPGILDRPVIVPVVRGDTVAAFAVGRLRGSEDALFFEPIESVLSPLTGFDAEAPQVPSALRGSGLALALRADSPSASVDEPVLGGEEAVG